MRVLITGGFGYVGSRIAKHMQQAGHQIILGSRSSRKIPDWLPLAEVVQTDWSDTRALLQSCTGVDVVIHTAGMNSRDCVADPMSALEVNGLATARLLAAASKSRAKRFIYLSTAHVYANPLVGTITEETCPRNLHPYSTSHLVGENAVLGACQHGEIEGIVLRLSNAFGAPMHIDANCWMLLVNDLCRQAVESERMVLHSSGLQQRDFIALTVVCRVVEQLSFRDLKALPFNVFNVGSGESQSVLEMAKLVQYRCRSVLGFEPELQRPEPNADEGHELLLFRSGRLNAIGVNVGFDNAVEIDDLLKYCQAWGDQNWRDST